MLPVALENLLVGVVGLALLLYLGVGLCARLPGVLLPYRFMLAPWVGYCLLVVVTQFLTNSPLALTALQSGYVALGMATVINGVALVRGWGSGVGGREPADQLPVPDSRFLALLTLSTFVLCLLPIWSYGYNTVIGENWDAEIYLGLGEYLKSYAQVGLHSALPNPILDTLVNPPYGLRTHGFSYFQAALGFLPLDSLHTLAPALALVRALSIPAAYVFFREGLHLPSRPALWACAALGLNAFLLWVTYNTFGMQVPTFGLLPVAACLLMVALRTASNMGATIRSLPAPSIWTGLVLAGLAVTYHPALTAFAAMAGLAVLVLLITLPRARVRVLATVAAIGVSTLALSLVSQVKSLEGFLKQYSEKTAGLGLTGFTAPGDAFGFSLSFRDLLPAGGGRPLLSLLSTLYTLAGWLVLVIALLLILLYAYRLWTAPTEGEKRLAWSRVGLIAGAFVYVLLFLRPLNYPYGWFKALSFVSFVWQGAAVGGLRFLLDWRGLSGIRSSRLLRDLALLSGAGALLLVLFTTVLTVGRYWREPLRYDRAMLEVGAVRPIVTAGGSDRSVYIGSSPNMRALGQLYNGILSYFLRDTDLYGTFDTANSKLDREKSSGVYRYSLLHADDDPAEYGVAGGQLAWHNSLISLYELLPEGERTELYHHNFRGDSTYPAVSEGVGTHFNLGAESLTPSKSAASASAPLAGARQFSLGLASFTTATLSVGFGGRNIDLVVPPGYSIYRSGSITSTGDLTLGLTGNNTGGKSVYLRWTHLDRYTGGAGQEQALSSGGAGLLVSAASAQAGDEILTRVSYLNNRPGAVSQTLSLDIYGAGSGGAHYGYWNVGVPANVSVDLDLLLDPARKAVTLDSTGAATLADQFKGDAGDGTYTASLLVYENGQVAEAFNDIFRFEIKGGKPASFKPRSLPPLFR